MRTDRPPSSSDRYLLRHERPQFQAHSVEHLHQARDLHTAEAQTVQEEADLDGDHSARERDLAPNQRGSQIGAVLLRLRYDDLQRHTDATEINLHGAEIPPNDPASLSAELGGHLRRKAGLFAQEPEILFVQEAKHWAVPLDGDLVKPIGGHRKFARRESRAANEEPKANAEGETY
jgi:hypothetical protein